jgi:hypothetical protein
MNRLTRSLCITAGQFGIDLECATPDDAVGVTSDTRLLLRVPVDLLESHGGSISCKSTAGADSTFIVRVPLSDNSCTVTLEKRVRYQ